MNKKSKTPQQNAVVMKPMPTNKPQPPTDQDASKYTDAQHVSNLVMLVARLVEALRISRKHMTTSGEEHPVAAQSMDYLRRADLQPSILRGVTKNIKRPKWEYGLAESNGNAVPTCSKCGWAIRSNHKEHEEACW